VLESPFSDLDEGYWDLIAEAVEKARRGWGCALVVANVDPGRAKSWGDRVLILHGGRSRTSRPPSLIPSSISLPPGSGSRIPPWSGAWHEAGIQHTEKMVGAFILLTLFTLLFTVAMVAGVRTGFAST